MAKINIGSKSTAFKPLTADATGSEEFNNSRNWTQLYLETDSNGNMSVKVDHES